MMKVSFAVFGFSLALPIINCSPTYAKKIYPAELLGRELLMPKLGWAGHVAIATTDMMSQ